METDKKSIAAGLIAVKIHRTDKGNVIGACDSHLLGKKISEGGLVMEISKEFYFERHATGEELSLMLEECMTANLVGEAAIAAYCKNKPDAKGLIRKIGGVPHLQVFEL